jgi:adenylate cyclase
LEKRRFTHDLWGDPGNVASRMDSHGINREFQESGATRSRTDYQFELESRGTTPTSSKGDMPV